MLRVTCEHHDDLAEDVVKALLTLGARIKAVNTKEPTLEEAFISLTGGEEEIDRFIESGSPRK